MDSNDLTAKVLASWLTGVHSEILWINCSLNKMKAGAKSIALPFLAAGNRIIDLLIFIAGDFGL